MLDRVTSPDSPLCTSVYISTFTRFSTTKLIRADYSILAFGEMGLIRGGLLYCILTIHFG